MTSSQTETGPSFLLVYHSFGARREKETRDSKRKNIKTKNKIMYIVFSFVLDFVFYFDVVLLYISAGT